MIANTQQPEGERKLFLSCDTKPAFAAKIDFIDDTHLLILRNLLKAKNRLKVPAYMAHPLFFIAILHN